MTLEDFLKLPGAKVHDGGDMPVHGAMWIEAFVRAGGTIKHRAHYLDWSHDGDGFDVIAYREAP